MEIDEQKRRDTLARINLLEAAVGLLLMESPRRDEYADALAEIAQACRAEGVSDDAFRIERRLRSAVTAALEANEGPPEAPDVPPR